MIPTIDQLKASRDRMMEKIANAAARAEGLSGAQRAAYLAAIVAQPTSGPKGEPIPLHEIGMKAARAVRS